MPGHPSCPRHSHLAEAVHEGELIQGPALEPGVDPAGVGRVPQLHGADVRQGGMRYKDADRGAPSLQSGVLAPADS